jgi:hypothetical protein
VCCFRSESRRSSVGLVTRIWDERPRNRGFIPCKRDIFLFSILSRSAVGPTQPPLQCVPDALSLGIKLLGHKGDLSCPSTIIFENTWKYTSIHSNAFMAWQLIKHSNNFTSTVTSELSDRSKWMWVTATRLGFRQVLRRMPLGTDYLNRFSCDLSIHCDERDSSLAPSLAPQFSS